VKVNLLTREQIFGKKRLKIFDQHGVTAELTDLALLLGAETHKNNPMKKKFGRKYVVTNYCCLGQPMVEYDYDNMNGQHIIPTRENLCVTTEGELYESKNLKGKIEAFRMPQVWRMEPHRVITKKSKKPVNFPQNVADARTSTELEIAFNKNTLKRTGRFYTFDKYYKEGGRTSYDKNNYHKKEFTPIEFPVYRADNGDKYIRIQARTNFKQVDIRQQKSKKGEESEDDILLSDSKTDITGYEKIIFDANGVITYNFIVKPEDDYVLSTGERIDHNKFYWVKVTPIEWLVDKKFMVSAKCLFSGIRFLDRDKYLKLFQNEINWAK
jgi:hypothetical protein